MTIENALAREQTAILAVLPPTSATAARTTAFVYPGPYGATEAKLLVGDSSGATAVATVLRAASSDGANPQSVSTYAVGGTDNLEMGGFGAFVHLLPYLEQEALFRRWDLNGKWYDPPNADLVGTEIKIFYCPSNRARGVLDFAFVDGWHLFDFTLVDFYYIDKLLEVGGHVAFDDMWLPAVRKVVSFVLRNKPYKLVRTTSRYPAPLWKRTLRIGRRAVQDPMQRGWRLKFVPQNIAVLQKTAADTRTWDFHRSF